VSHLKNVTLLSVPGRIGIQDNEDMHALAWEGSSSPFLGPEPSVSVSLKIKEKRNTLNTGLPHCDVEALNRKIKIKVKLSLCLIN
jgi:hypothetical protein